MYITVMYNVSVLLWRSVQKRRWSQCGWCVVGDFCFLINVFVMKNTTRIPEMLGRIFIFFNKWKLKEFQIT